MWCVAELDEEYIRRLEDGLAVYEKPLSEREPVVCIDEKPVVLHADLRPPRPLQPGQTLRRDSEYERRGTANAFCGVEPKAGWHHLRVTPDRSSPEFADYRLQIAEPYPAADTIHLVMDNLSSHTRKAVHGALYAHPRQLAQSGRDRNQPVRPAVSGKEKNPIAGSPAAGSQSLGPDHEP